MKYITTDELMSMSNEGLVLQGCGGNSEEWLKGINELFTEERILLEGDTFKDGYVFEHDGLTNILFNIEDVKLNVGKLAIWRLQTHSTFGGTWLSDYLSNQLGVEMADHAPSHEVTSIDIGRQEEAPPIADKESDGVTIRALIVNRDDMVGMFANIDRLKEGKFARKWHSFPTTVAELQTTLNEIGLNNAKHQACLTNDFEGISESLRDALSMFTDLNELNYLAVKLSGLTDSQREVFEAVLESGRHRESVTDVINLTENLNCFDLQPAYSAEQYGEFLLTMDQDLVSETIEKINKSNDPNLHDLVSYIEKLENHVDTASYGRARAAEENGVFLECGYLTENDDFKIVYRGPEDIPKQYRVFDVTALPIRVENTDLTDLVFKMHALGGECTSPEDYHIRMLASDNKTDYLLMMTSNTIFLDAVGSCYQRQEHACRNWLSNTADTKRAFAIHIRSNENGRVYGDITEVDFSGLRLDIQEHAVHCEHVEAVTGDGTEQSFSGTEWEALSAEQYDSFDGWTVYYNSDEIRDLNAHLREQRQERGRIGRLMEPDEFLRYLNSDFMKSAENPQPDMLRIAQNAATKILARSDAPVFRLLPDGPQALTPLDALKRNGELWFAIYREFAVKKDDWAGIDKWAKRETNAALKYLPGRDASKKNKRHDPEH